MLQSHPGALALSRRVLRVLIGLNLLIGFGILALLLISFISGDWLMAGLGIEPTLANRMAMPGMRLLMCYGIVAVVIAHLVLTQLRAIVVTVSEGDPFVEENASRLRRIAWAVLGLELVRLGFGLIPLFLPSGIRRDGSASLVPWLAVLLLFVLAQVFDHGTRMRNELEGTV